MNLSQPAQMLPLKAARVRSLVVGGLFFLLLFFGFQTEAKAAQNQTCYQDSQCTVGEFLYDDNYQPITDASCSLNLKTPSGASYITGQSLTPEADGWYAHQFVPTGSDSLGLYRGSICCTAGSEYLCLDKSINLEAVAESITASDVWDSPNRTLTDFGTLPTDVATAVWSASTRSLTTFGSLSTDVISGVWSSSNRTLTGFGTLVADIWNYSTRTITGGSVTATVDSSNLATKDDITAAKDEVKDQVTDSQTDISSLATQTDLNNLASLILGSAATTTETPITVQTLSTQLVEVRNSLETLVNAPIVESDVLISGASLNLESKLQQSETIAVEYQTQSQTLASKLKQLERNWNQLSTEEIERETASLLANLGSQQDTASSTSLSGWGAWLKTAWNNRLTQNLAQTTNDSVIALQELVSELEFYGKTLTAKNLVSRVSSSLSSVSGMVGSSQTRSNATTLLGYLEQIRQTDKRWQELDQSLSQLLVDWGQLTPNRQLERLRTLAFEVKTLNQLPDAGTTDIVAQTDSKKLRNQVLGLKATVQLNRAYLASEADQPLKNVWLEEGSIIFKVQATNPSRLVRQTVPVKFYLPKELNEEDIVSLDEGLEIKFDHMQDTLYAQGTFDLAPNTTRTLDIEVRDIWVIDLAEIESIRRQADALSQPLEQTSYFGQSVLLRTDINTTLSRIESTPMENLTPEGRIKAYREAQLELIGAKEKLLELQRLVGEADSGRSVFGFVGGVQSIAVWGLILITIAGFVFLTIYMRSITLASRPVRPYQGPTLTNIPPHTSTAKKSRSASNLKSSHLVFLVLATSGLSSLLFGSLIQLRQPRTDSSRLASPISEAETVSNAVLGTQSQVRYFLVPAKGEKISLWQGPSQETKVFDISQAVQVTLQDTHDDWSLVELSLEESDKIIRGWVQSEFLQVAQ